MRIKQLIVVYTHYVTIDTMVLNLPIKAEKWHLELLFIYIKTRRREREQISNRIIRVFF